MKNIIFGILASMMFTSAVFADGSKKGHIKKVSKTERCSKANCSSGTNCTPANCVSMPCCK